MKTDTLEINQISEAAYAWYLGYLQAIDDKDVEKYGTYLAENCRMTQNNQESVRGKEAVLKGLAQYWQTFHSLEHELLNIYGSDTAFALEALNHYERKDGGRVTARAVALTSRNEAGLVEHFRFYTDVSSVFAPADKQAQEQLAKA